MQSKTIWLFALTGLLLIACAEKEPEFPWVSDLDTRIEANGKMVGYEFWAKW